MQAGVSRPPSLGTVGGGLGRGGRQVLTQEPHRGTEYTETDVSAHSAGHVARCPPGRRGRCGYLEADNSAIPTPLRTGPDTPLQPWRQFLGFAACTELDLRRSVGG